MARYVDFAKGLVELTWATHRMLHPTCSAFRLATPIPCSPHVLSLQLLPPLAPPSSCTSSPACGANLWNKSHKLPLYLLIIVPPPIRASPPCGAFRWCPQRTWSVLPPHHADSCHCAHISSRYDWILPCACVTWDAQLCDHYTSCPSPSLQCISVCYWRASSCSLP